MIVMGRFSILLATFVLLPTLVHAGTGRPEDSNAFETTFKDGKITSLRCAEDRFKTDFLAQDARLGEVSISYRRQGGAWEAGTPDKPVPDPDGHGARWNVGNELAVHSWFELQGTKLRWRLQLINRSTAPLEIGGLSTPLPMRTRFDKDSHSGVLKHSFISGAGSFAFWMRPDSIGPYLTMIPVKGTSLEYWRRSPNLGYEVFIHSASEVSQILAHQGSWRLPHSSRVLEPGKPVEYGYDFTWSSDYQAVRDRLATSGKLDVQIAPGMTVPSDLFVEVALRSSSRIEAINAEYPAETDIRFMGSRKGYRIYRLRFRRLGENRLTVEQVDGAKTYLEFFSCQPLETLIKKRASFLESSQVKDSSKWYDGLFREQNLATGKLLSPDDYDRITGWRIYEVTCDDPGLSKPAFLAAKNAEFPVPSQIAALDRYIEHFVWGGLQQTTDELYPYSIYGIPDWKTLRNSKVADRTKGVDHVWRCYDYPHIVLLYYSMFRIASENPGIKTRLTASEYLQRAFGTAEAMFTVPDKLVKWSAYETGFYNEIVLPSLISDLRRNGQSEMADTLAGYWAKKVRVFVSGKVDLFSSEYAFDSTGFETTQVLADEAIRNGKYLGIELATAKAFLDRQMAANIFCRGLIEPAYYTLGSDYRASGGDGYTLSYMAPMGGTSILDYGLNYASDPATYLRLGYQSILSSWALMNAGTPESNYGFWYPGAGNDGGAGGGFEPAAYGKTWLDQPSGRGSWYYSCETDLGYCGYLRAARTIVFDDPIFGRFCYGGIGEQVGKTYRFIPHDGLRRRLSIRMGKTKFDVELSGTKFAPSAPIILDEQQGVLMFQIEPVSGPKGSLLAFGQERPLPSADKPRQVTIDLHSRAVEIKPAS